MTELGPYRLVRLLGRGGMGEVWEATDSQGAPVAVKTLSAGQHPGAALRHLLDEAKLAASLVHPHIVRVLDVGQTDGRGWFAMERLDGVTLADVKRPVPLPAVVALALQGLSALSYAQRTHRVVHRDLKPSNLFVTRSGQLKLIDFGLARGLASESTRTQTGMVRGSLAYLAPEQARGEAVDGRSDVYAFALVLHELLSGKRVFDHSQEAALLGQVLWSPVADVREHAPQTPEPVAKALAWALEREPSKRPADAETLAQAFRTCGVDPWDEARLGTWVRSAIKGAEKLLHETAEVALPQLSAAPAPPPKPNRSWLAAAIPVLAAIAMLVAWVNRSRQPDVPEEHEPPAPVAEQPVETGLAPEPTAPAPEPVATPEPIEKPTKKKPKRVTKTEAPVAGPPGFLTIDSKPLWAEISLDGRALGPTPVVRISVASGTHRLKAVRSDGQRSERTVEVQAEKETRVLLTW